MFHLGNITNENNKEQWKMAMYSRSSLQNLDSGSGKTNALLNLISQQYDIDNIYLYAKDLSEAKYEIFKKRELAEIKHLNDSNAFTECSNTMDDVYENINITTQTEKEKSRLCLMTWLSNKKLQAVVTELFIRCRKLNISLVLSLSLMFLFQKMSD